MKNKSEKKTPLPPKTDKDSLKPQEDNQLHKGYNEKNPAQPQGAFTPDSKTGKK